MNALELVRKYFPDASDEFTEHVLWNRTGFPCFYPSGTTAEEHFGKQIAEFKKLYDEGKTPCEFCSNEATEGILCGECAEAMTRR